MSSLQVIHCGNVLVVCSTYYRGLECLLHCQIVSIYGFFSVETGIGAGNVVALVHVSLDELCQVILEALLIGSAIGIPLVGVGVGPKDYLGLHRRPVAEVLVAVSTLAPAKANRFVVGTTTAAVGLPVRYLAVHVLIEPLASSTVSVPCGTFFVLLVVLLALVVVKTVNVRPRNRLAARKNLEVSCISNVIYKTATFVATPVVVLANILAVLKKLDVNGRLTGTDIDRSFLQHQD